MSSPARKIEKQNKREAEKANLQAVPPPQNTTIEELVKEGKVVKYSVEDVNVLANTLTQLQQIDLQRQLIQQQYNTYVLHKMAELGLKPSEWQYNENIPGFIKIEKPEQKDSK